MAGIINFLSSLFGKKLNTLIGRRWRRVGRKRDAIAHLSNTDSNSISTSQGTLKARLHTRLAWDNSDSTETIMVDLLRLIIWNDGAGTAHDISVEVNVGRWGHGKCRKEITRRHRMRISRMEPNSSDSSLILDTWQCPRDEYPGPGHGYAWPVRALIIRITWHDQSGKLCFYRCTHTERAHG